MMGNERERKRQLEERIMKRERGKKGNEKREK